ncbi:MAG: hypothetical protein RL885_31095 [Planctomycetota bacterium]
MKTTNSESLSTVHGPRSTVRILLCASVLLVLGAPALTQTLSDRSVYLNNENGQHDPELQEAYQDAGGHVYNGMLSGLNSGTTWDVSEILSNVVDGGSGIRRLLP